MVDASLLVAVALNEARRPAVRARLQTWSTSGENLHAPLLLHYEVASALAKAIFDGTATTERAVDGYEQITDLPIAYHDIGGDMQQILEAVSQLRRRSAYDAAYLVLSTRLEAPLFTLDGALYRNASELGYSINLIE